VSGTIINTMTVERVSGTIINSMAVERVSGTRKAKKPHPWKGTRFVIRGTTLVNTICMKILCSLHSDNGICRCIFIFLFSRNGPDANSGGELLKSRTIKVLSVTALSPLMVDRHGTFLHHRFCYFQYCSLLYNILPQKVKLVSPIFLNNRARSQSQRPH